MALEIIEAAEEEINELFPPKPGGLVDRYRKKAAEEEARRDEERNIAEKIEQSSYRAVKVAQQSPEVISALTYTIAPGQYAPVLPMSPYRFRATVQVITTGGTVVLAKDSGNAISGTGYGLLYAQPFTLYSRAQLYAFNNGASAVQVSVLAELYAPEEKR
jgi:hypothetical protein